MDFKLEDEKDRARILGYISGLDLEKPKKVSVTGADRSIEQNKMLHARLADIAAQV